MEFRVFLKVLLLVNTQGFQLGLLKSYNKIFITKNRLTLAKTKTMPQITSIPGLDWIGLDQILLLNCLIGENVNHF